MPLEPWETRPVEFDPFGIKEILERRVGSGDAELANWDIDIVVGVQWTGISGLLIRSRSRIVCQVCLWGSIVSGPFGRTLGGMR